MKWNYAKGLHALGNGAYAWLAPDGSWGWSNAGLIVDGGESLLVDTLFDLPLTAEMLAAMRRAEPDATRSIRTLVNTHANGDHCHGNELVEGAEIIASAAAAAEMDAVTPATMAAMMRTLATGDSPTARYLRHCFGAFEFEGIRHVPPTRTFERHLELSVGSKRVELIEVGPAHTRGDVLVHVPEDRTLFSGDILFIEGTPIVWAGPVQNWIDACERMLALDLATIVPGHGPITDPRGVRAVRDYLLHIRAEARRCYDEGVPAGEAARKIHLGEFAGWGDAERIAVNVHTLYREFDPAHRPPDVMTLFGAMGEMRDAWLR